MRSGNSFGQCKRVSECSENIWSSKWLYYEVKVDGCHLRGCVERIVLTTMGQDANDCIYPVIYAIVQKEKTKRWRWFMRYLQVDFEIDNGRRWTLMTDMQKGLENVCKELFPDGEHRFCMRHVYINFFNTEYKSKILKDFV